MVIKIKIKKYIDKMTMNLMKTPVYPVLRYKKPDPHQK